ncbi:uncharacterized protein PRCAT00003445001 [Priceomyces carsonii]|uniref:uncharacterized protein n=1 Tax=Priceomyces carsonii TaxID=28549 RepID=UPI002ED8ED41|nr:unnamed protein product [Priceomyces carsonii]
MSELLILPCHSIWKGGNANGDEREEWYLAPFQVEGYDHLSFKDHIKKSLDYLKNNSDSFLIISGGQTKQEAGPISESQSYYNLASSLLQSTELLNRVTTEEFARDSFENVIFLICRYFELFQKYPDSVTIVGFEFKRNRFINNHLVQALDFPKEKLSYIGNEPDPKDLNEIDRAKYFQDLDNSEYNFAVKYFDSDWYGVQGKLLKKKFDRNPFKRYHGYAYSNPQISDFIKALNGHTFSKSQDIKNSLNAPWS